MAPAWASWVKARLTFGAPLARGALAVLLLSLSVPALTGALMLASTDAPPVPGSGDKAADLALYNDFYRSRLRVYPFRPTNEVFTDLAIAASESARLVGTETDAGKALVHQAIDWQKAALAALPADSFGWSRLLALTLVEQGKGASDAPALLGLETVTAPYEPQLMVQRLSTTLTLYDRLDPEMRAGVPELMRRAWKLYPDEVDQMAKDRRATAWLLEALRASPETLDLLKKWRGI